MVMKMFSPLKVLSVFSFLFYCCLFAQDIDISVQLKDIEAGKVAKVKKDLADLQKKYPNNPSVLYLNALLTEDGKTAVGKYGAVAENYPKANMQMQHFIKSSRIIMHLVCTGWQKVISSS
jgi:hypothetical protein